MTAAGAEAPFLAPVNAAMEGLLFYGRAMGAISAASELARDRFVAAAASTAALQDIRNLGSCT